MATYKKISEDEFEEVISSPKVRISEINKKLDELRERRDAMVEPSKDELLEFAMFNHPYYLDINDFNVQIDSLKEFKDKLQSL